MCKWRFLAWVSLNYFLIAPYFGETKILKGIVQSNANAYVAIKINNYIPVEEDGSKSLVHYYLSLSDKLQVFQATSNRTRLYSFKQDVIADNSGL